MIEETRQRRTEGGKWWRLLEAGLGVALALVSLSTAISAEETPDLSEGIRALYRGEFEPARKVASAYAQAHPESVAARILLARAEISLGETESAYQHLLKALELDPTNIDALYYQGRVCALLSQTEFERLLATVPHSARAHQVLGEALELQHKPDDAGREYEAALKVAPRSVEILNALGELNRLQFHFDQAIGYYARAVELQPRDYTSAYGLGAAYLFKNDPKKAAEFLRRALAIDPESPAARLALGDALLRQGNAEAAVKELRAAVRVEPALRQAYTLMAQAYQRLGRNEEANAALKRSQELSRREIEQRESLLGEQSPSRQAPEPAGPPEAPRTPQ